MSQQAVKQVIQTLQHDYQLLQRLSPLLQKQYVLLSLRKTQELEPLNQEASELLGQIKRHHALRQQAMHQLHLPLSEQGFETLLSKLPNAIREASQNLLDKVQQHTQLCQQLNLKNGELLAQQRGLIQRLLGQPDQQSYPAPPF